MADVFILQLVKRRKKREILNGFTPNLKQTGSQVPEHVLPSIVSSDKIQMAAAEMSGRRHIVIYIYN